MSPDGTNTNNVNATGNGGNGTGTGNEGGQQGQQGADQQPKVFTQEQVDGIVRDRLAREADTRKTLQEQIDKLLPQAEKGSQLEKDLQTLTAQLKEAQRQAAFMELAPTVGCKNPKLAFLIAEKEQLYKKDGSPDWDAVKKVAPEIFGSASGSANAGSGSRTGNTPVDGMNNWIRKASGK